MIEVEISRIIIDEKKREQILVLKEKDGIQLLPIVVGINEAAAIRLHLSGQKPPRPMTHDLIKSILDNCSLSLQKVVIDQLKDNVFYAKLYLDGAEDSISVDARPSDSIALAVRTGSPLFVEEEVFDALAREEEL